MKISRLIATAACLISAICLAHASDALYAVGPFNGWDAKSPLVFTRNDNNIFSIELDFSGSREFKMSTTTGAGSQGNGWTEFDAGALKPVNDATLGEWVEITHNSGGNINAPENKPLQVQVDLAAMRMRFVKSAAPEYSGTLPVLHIDTENGNPITSKETYLQATYYLDPLGTPGIEAIGTADTPLPLQIRGRGNYTWTGFDKKPYRLKFAEKAAILGMNKSKHFVLLAHADDRVGFMRNTLGFAASRLLGLPWTPAQKPVEVVLNGDYIGLYFLTENIRVAKDRVNIVEQDDLSTTDVDGGWLVEIDNYDSDPHVTVMENTYPIWFTYKSPEVLSPEQTEFLQGQMQDIQDAIEAKDYSAFSSLVDVDILARYYIVQEIMNDYESFHGSCYLNRQRGQGNLWKFGPVWDFGSALFNDNDNRFIYESNYHQVWIGAICAAFPEFTVTVKNVWREFLEKDGADALNAEGAELAAHIAEAAKANYRRWPEYGNADETREAAVAFNRLNSKIDWLKKQWGAADGIAVADWEDLQPRIRAVNGILYVSAGRPCTISLAGIDGTVRSLTLKAGLNTFTDIPAGIYIAERTKIVL